LQREGYSPGPANGVMTEQTRRAIAAYAARSGRPPDALAGSGPAEGPIERAQAGLQRLGLFGGPVDGVVGPQTRDAIIRFQAGRHVAIDPRVSDALLAALDAAGAGASAVPAASAAAAPPSAPETAASAPPPSAPSGAVPEALGRRPLPDWVNPPAIR